MIIYYENYIILQIMIQTTNNPVYPLIRVILFKPPQQHANRI